MRYLENKGVHSALQLIFLHFLRNAVCVGVQSSEDWVDLIACRHVQVRLMGNFSLNGGIPWLAETNASLCFTCREDNKTLCHLFFDCPTFKPNFDLLWCKLLLKASSLNVVDGTQISQFITSLDLFHKTILLLGCFRLPIPLSLQLTNS